MLILIFAWPRKSGSWHILVCSKCANIHLKSLEFCNSWFPIKLLDSHHRSFLSVTRNIMNSVEESYDHIPRWSKIKTITISIWVLWGWLSVWNCRCGISFCYKCGKQVYQHWCSCDRTSMCCEWCCRVCIVLIFLTFAFFFLSWLTRRHKIQKWLCW